MGDSLTPQSFSAAQSSKSTLQHCCPMFESFTFRICMNLYSICVSDCDFSLLAHTLPSHVIFALHIRLFPVVRTRIIMKCDPAIKLHSCELTPVGPDYLVVFDGILVVSTFGHGLPLVGRFFCGGVHRHHVTTFNTSS